MIPLKISLKNFVSYGQETQTINFEPYSLICLSGKNGHGKSALLDAITWSIWGQARKVQGSTKSDENLLRLGQTQMMVSFDFKFNNNIYRIRREVSVSSGKTTASLEFGIFDPILKTLKPLTDKNIKLTQEKITKTINLDYESFINSAFLRQGQSNEFSKKSAKDRKEILANILGIEKYETIRKRAYDIAKETQGQIDNLNILIVRIKKELELKSNTENEIKSINSAINNIEKSDIEILEKYKSTKEKLNKINILKSNLESKKLQVFQNKKRIEEKLIIINRESKKFRDINKAKNNTADINEINQKLINLEEIFKLKIQLKNIYDDIEKNWKEYNDKFEPELIYKEKEKELISKKTEEIKLKINLLGEIKETEKFRVYQERFKSKKELILKLLKELENNPLLKNDNKNCPTCSIEIDFQKLENIRSDINKKISIYKNQIIRLENGLLEANLLRKENETNCQKYKELNLELSNLEIKYKLLSEDINKLRTNIDLNNKTKEDSLKNNSDLPKIKDRLESLKLFEVHDIQNEILKLHQIKQNHIILLENILQQSERKNIVKITCQQVKAIKLEINNFNIEIDKILKLLEYEQNLLIQEKELENSINQNQKNKEALLMQKGYLEAQNKTIVELKNQLKNYNQEIKILEKTSSDYSIIATAMSKDGIQALIIEEAIPEIEKEANDILSRLSDNQSQIIIESLKDLKNGSTKETLDIKISDPAGIRSYELFSGGEAFRIDFALRIAISKLLARRSGSSLQTMIIDEGFGSQDEEGLHNIMESIYKIKDEFEKIIIVSHLPYMKDHFPVHFIVNKGPQGSSISVLEQEG